MALSFNFNLHKEIIVYLDYHSKVSSSGNLLYLDFRQSKDLITFINSFKGTSNKALLGSYISVIGYTTKKRLMRGCYYSLNINALQRATVSFSQDSYLIFAEFDFSNCLSPEKNSDELLLSHSQLDSQELLVKSHNINIPAYTKIALENLELYVADVGQANWNELRYNGYTIVQYDIGAELHAKRKEVDEIFKKHHHRIDPDNKALLVISHWDMDHIHCLCSMTEDEIAKSFCMVWCPDAIKSNTARNLYNKLVSALGKDNIHCILPHLHEPGTEYHIHPLHEFNNYISLYIGEKRRNINHSGLVMFVKGDKASANYTGDCLLRQANEVFQYELNKGAITKNRHILIAPHHGGENNDKDMIYNSVRSVARNDVYISVGNNNLYGHPHYKMLNYLQQISRNNVKQTNIVGDLTANL